MDGSLAVGKGIPLGPTGLSLKGAGVTVGYNWSVHDEPPGPSRYTYVGGLEATVGLKSPTSRFRLDGTAGVLFEYSHDDPILTLTLEVEAQLLEAISGDWRGERRTTESHRLVVPFRGSLDPGELTAERWNEGDAWGVRLVPGREIPGELSWRFEERSGEFGARVSARRDSSAPEGVYRMDYANVRPGERRYYRARLVLPNNEMGPPSDPVAVTTWRRGTLVPRLSPVHPRPDWTPLRWTHTDPGVRGYRLYIDGELVVDESELGPLVRDHRYPTALLPDGELELVLRAVGSDGEESPVYEDATRTLRIPEQILPAFPPRGSDDAEIPVPPPAGAFAGAEVQNRTRWFDPERTRKESSIEYVEIDGNIWLHGTSERYTPRGQLLARLKYRNGELVGGEWYDLEGNRLE